MDSCLYYLVENMFVYPTIIKKGHKIMFFTSKIAVLLNVGKLPPVPLAIKFAPSRKVKFSSGHLIVMLMASYRGGTDRIKVPNDHSRLVHVAGVMVSNCNFHFLASRGSSIASRASLNIPTQQNRSLSSIYLVL